MNFRKIYHAWRDAGLLRCDEKERVRLIMAQVRLHPGLEKLLIQEGAARLMPVWARKFATPPSQAELENARVRAAERKQAFSRFVQEDEVKAEKAKNFDRIVEMLDHKTVGNKLLGDCTRADLLRAAVAEDAKAKEATIEAGFYRLLAGMIGTGTVREASDRGKIVALLTTTFREAA